MSYDAIEDRAQDLLQLLTGTFAKSSQVTRGDWRILDSGDTPLAVLYGGAFTQIPDADCAYGEQGYDWTLNCDLFVRYLDEGTTAVTLTQTRDAVVGHIAKYPQLNALAGIVDVSHVQGGEFIQIFDKDGNGPFFLQTTLSWTVREVAAVAFLEP